MPNSDISPRRPRLALVLSAMLPGLGQLYNGQLNKGIFLFLAFAFVTIPLIVFIALVLPSALLMPLLALSLVATVSLYGFGLRDAWRVARHSADYRPYPWQQPAINVSNMIILPKSDFTPRNRLILAKLHHSCHESPYQKAIICWTKNFDFKTGIESQQRSDDSYSANIGARVISVRKPSF